MLRFIILAIICSQVSTADIKLTEKIVGGQVAESGSIPFQAGLLVRRAPEGILLCGGSLISNNAVLTAAHCLKDTLGSVVVLGAHNITNLNETGAVRMFANASSYIIHPQFSFRYARNDIALIILPTAVNFTERIQPVKLPSGLLFAETFAGEIGKVSGFGRYCDNCTSSQVLRYVHNTILSNEECAKSYRSVSIPNSNQLCMSGVEGKSSCRGE